MTSPRHLLIISFLILAAITGNAESRYSILIGQSRTADTYISPLRYSGIYTAVDGWWSRPVSSHGWSINGTARIEAAFLKNPAFAGREYNLMANASIGASREFQLPWEITVSPGAGLNIEAGGIFLPYNGNNPASAKAFTGAEISLSASRKFNIRSRPARISLRASLPSLGVAFSPQFGESYYEIYLGNHSGLARLAWWGNRFRFSSILAFDISLGRHTLSLGYHYSILSSEFSCLRTHISTHALSIGIIPGKL